MEVKLHEHQWQAFKSQAKFVALISGTGGGKSFMGPIWMYGQISEAPAESFLIVAPTYKMLFRTCVPALEKAFKGTHYEGALKETKGQYLLPTGGIIYLGSADNPDSLEGLHVKAAWIDEASLCDRMVWVIVQARVGIKDGRILLTTTPRGFNWLYNDFYKYYIAGDKDYAVIQFRSIDNPHYPKTEFERMKKTLDPRMFKMRYEGEFAKMSGLVYPDFDQANLIDEVPKNFQEVICGVDWGFNAPCALVVLGIDGQGNYSVIDEYIERGKLIDTIARQAKIMRDKYGIQMFYCDPSRPEFIATFNCVGLLATAGNNSIISGIEEVSMCMRTKRLKVARHCKHIIDELETYAYPEDGLKDLPVKTNDHALDALRYALRTHSIERQLKSLPQEQDVIVGIEDVIPGFERVQIGRDYDPE